MSDCDPIIIEGSADFSHKARQVVESARFELCWVSFRLDRSIYGHEEFSDAVKRLVLADPRNRVRILINQAHTATREGCRRVVDLAQAVPSRMEIRQIPEEQLADWRCEWILADSRVLLERHTPDAITAKHWENAPFHGQRMRKDFNELWEVSEPTVEFRRLAM